MLIRSLAALRLLIVMAPLMSCGGEPAPITDGSDDDPQAGRVDAGKADAGKADAGKAGADAGKSDSGKADAGKVVKGDGVRGGALYDSFWAAKKEAPPTGDHPLWASRPDDASNTRTGPDTWRCKECHGWDYEGVDGAYGKGGHRTGIIGVLGTRKTAAQIVALLSDPDDHAYADLLDAQDIADLAAFVKEFAVDTSKFISETGAFRGDEQAGEPIFSGTCAACHGAEGLNTELPGASGGFEDFPGFIANDNPQEFLHKVRFGQPGTAMAPQAEKLSNDELADLGAYTQTLPEAP